MSEYVSDIAFTPSVKAVQEHLGSRGENSRLERDHGWQTVVTPQLAAFLAERDSFYFATASADGRPYVQHRGGLPGVLKVIDERTLAFGDYAGNRQYISLGNLAENDRAFIFLMDYASRRRIKLWGRAEVVEGDDALTQRVTDSDYAKGAPQRVIRFRLEAWDMNCPAHIPRKFSEAQVEAITAGMRARIEELEREVKALRER